MHDGGCTSVRNCAGVTTEFHITTGVYQGSILSHFLFATVMDKLTCAL
jgi:hypothetical protein